MSNHYSNPVKEGQPPKVTRVRLTPVRYDQDRPASRAQRLGIDVNHDGKRHVVSLSGVEHFDEARELIKQIGFRYDKVGKVWFTKSKDIAAALVPHKVDRSLTRPPVDIFKVRNDPIRPRWLGYSKDLANFPLARGARCKAQWQGGKAQLPGERKVTLRLAPGALRCPTAFDENLKLTLLALARMHSSPTLVFKSYAGLITVLGYSADTRRVALLRDSLSYLSRLSVTIKTAAQRVTLPPLIKELQLPANGEPLMIEINEDFYREALNDDKPQAWLPLPLPKGHVAQNLLMLMTASRFRDLRADNGSFVDGYRERPLVPMAVLARKCGLSNRGSRNADLRAAMKAVEAIYQKHGAALMFQDRNKFLGIKGTNNALVRIMIEGKMKFKRDKDYD